MKKVYQLYKNISSVIVVAGLAVTSMFTACNQEFDEMLPDTEYVDSASVSYGNPKVLYIIADGARGQSVRDARSPNISALLPKSIYTWVSISDETVEENGTSWADMLTGVGKSKHGVIENNISVNNFQSYPLIYKRVKEVNANSDIRVFTTSSLFKDNLANDADVKEVLANDGAVKERTVASLADASVTFVTAHFSGIDKAGEQNGYDLSKQGYKDAIMTFDNYVGEMMAALRARPTYNQENWLVVITSSRGGEYELPAGENDNTIFSNTKVNTFTIYHATRYKTRFIGKPYLGNRYQGDFVRFNGQRKAQVTAGDNSVYNLGLGEFTLEIKIKKNIGPNNNYEFRYPSILGKRAEWTSGWPGGPGWNIFLENKMWMFNARGTSNVGQIAGADLANATWNTISVVAVIRDNKRYIRTFTNGAFNREAEITGWGNLDNNSLLTLGYMNGSGHGEPDAYLADVRIWKAALPDSVVNRFACDTFIDPGHPYYDYLAGYWPVVGSDEQTITDNGPFGSHMTLSGGTPAWVRLSEYLCAPSTDNIGSFVPRNVDIPAQIISWLKIPRQESWQLDGRVWLDQ